MALPTIGGKGDRPGGGSAGMTDYTSPPWLILYAVIGGLVVLGSQRTASFILKWTKGRKGADEGELIVVPTYFPRQMAEGQPDLSQRMVSRLQLIATAAIFLLALSVLCFVIPVVMVFAGWASQSFPYVPFLLSAVALEIAGFIVLHVWARLVRRTPGAREAAGLAAALRGAKPTPVEKRAAFLTASDQPSEDRKRHK